MKVIKVDKISQRTIFECEFCGLRDRQKSYVEKHEKTCRKNPNSKFYEGVK